MSHQRRVRFFVVSRNSHSQVSAAQARRRVTSADVSSSTADWITGAGSIRFQDERAVGYGHMRPCEGRRDVVVQHGEILRPRSLPGGDRCEEAIEHLARVEGRGERVPRGLGPRRRLRQ